MTKKAIEYIKVILNEKEFNVSVDNPDFMPIINFVVKTQSHPINVTVEKQGEKFDDEEFKKIIETSIEEFKEQINIQNEKYETLEQDIKTLKEEMKIDNPIIEIEN